MQEYRTRALESLDIERFFAEQGVELRALNETERRFLCPFHDDHNPSANVNVREKTWFCHACQIGGSPIDFLQRKGMSFKEALTEVGRLAGMDPPSVGRTAAAAPKLKKANVEEWHEAALRNPELMRWFAEKRGYTEQTVRDFRLGWDGQRVTIPIYDENGKLANVRRYKRDARESKMVGIAAGHNSARLFPFELPLPDEVILVEGEWDAILMRQQGFGNTLTVTSGAGVFPMDALPHFGSRTVTIIYDNDDTGRRGAAKVARHLSSQAQVRILNIPGLPDKGDVTDFFVEQGRSADELASLLMDATPYVAAPDATEEGEATPVALYKASDAAYRGKRLAIPTLVSGKAMTPYTVPYEFTFVCSMSNKRYCGICPMMEVNGQRHVKLSPADPAVLSLINVSDQQQTIAMRKLAKAVTACNLGQVDIKASINVEELRMIPELDRSVDEGEHEYVTRTGYFLGHGLMPNRSYTVSGYTHPSPKTQATVHLLSEAVPAQDHIGAFAMTPEIAKELAIFRVESSLDRKLRDIYDDLRMHVHRIHGRFDMQMAYDLVWHSVIAFYFNGSFVRRGWAETMVMGDSGQGKTEMAMGLLSHYRMGQRVQGEQASGAGLLGGLEKMADTWMLSWGALPLNDKRLLVVDETQGLPEKMIEAMSDVRATGVAEITKIRTERTSARCRLIWLANPPDGVTLSQHNQGVRAFPKLFSKPEDIRRLDFGITVASGDVDVASHINIRHTDTAPHRYISDACRKLILWAWSRRPDQVIFSDEATDAILTAATEMGRRYHSSIPLVEPADQRLKLARLSAALAARVFSSDESGEKVIVDAEHVAYIVEYLNRVYSTRMMAYDEYSDQMRRVEVLDEAVETRVRSTIATWENSEGAISFLRSVNIFKKGELADATGWEDAYLRSQLQFLVGSRLLRTVKQGYVKTPILIDLLRQIEGDGRPADLTSLLAEDVPWIAVEES